MDHKLYIVLNKADQFRKVISQRHGTDRLEEGADFTHNPPHPQTPHPHLTNTAQQIHDFARAYGSLCWNLSKVIPRKDLPRIYTMCLPVQYQRRGDHLSLGQGQLGQLGQAGGDEEASSLGQGLVDLERSRDEVVGEVLKAPKRRIDNVITRLADSVHLVQMHARVLEALRADFARELWAFRVGAAGLATAGVGLVAGGAYAGLAVQPLLAFAALYLAGSGGFLYYNGKVLGEYEAAMASPEGLRRLFERLYARQVLEGDELITSLWKRAFPALQMMVVDTQLARLPRVTGAELRELERILEEDIPGLRRLAAPVSWSYKQRAPRPAPITGAARSFANMIGSTPHSEDGQAERRAQPASGSGSAYQTVAAVGVSSGMSSSPPRAASAGKATAYTSWKVE